MSDMDRLHWAGGLIEVLQLLRGRSRVHDHAESHPQTQLLMILCGIDTWNVNVNHYPSSEFAVSFGSIHFFSCDCIITDSLCCIMILEMRGYVNVMEDKTVLIYHSTELAVLQLRDVITVELGN